MLRAVLNTRLPGATGCAQRLEAAEGALRFIFVVEAWESQLARRWVMVAQRWVAVQSARLHQAHSFWATRLTANLFDSCIKVEVRVGCQLLVAGRDLG